MLTLFRVVNGVMVVFHSSDASKVLFTTRELRVFNGTTADLTVNISGGNPAPGPQDIRWDKGSMISNTFNGSRFAMIIAGYAWKEKYFKTILKVTQG